MSFPMNVVLIGYRGTGKSSVGKVLAERLDRPLLSTDAEVVRLAGQTIPAIVEQHGWEYFRDLESKVCQELAGQNGLIIDTGGGAILRSQNVDVFKQTGRLFWLTASVETIAKRIGSDTQRPSLTGTKSFVDEIRDVLQDRLPKYQAAGDYVIETEGRSLSQVADEILSKL
ncbi:MAG: shikimate kinase [Nitrospira sp. WS238]|nr:shikimate kinase [Nitrospira sp. WS238]